MLLLQRLADPKFLANLNANNEVAGYQSPTSGRITYNKIVDKKSFAVFSDIITAIIPPDVVYDTDENQNLPSLANVLAETFPDAHVYPKYLYVNATMTEYMDYEDEEDQENMDDLFSDLDDLPIKTPLVGLVIQKSEHMGSAHAIAFIAWKPSPRKYKFAYYDPLAHKKGAKSYDFADRAFDAARFTQKIEFINLATYCFQKTPEEFHCSQYVINAEYCYVYCVFFLHKWLEAGAKLHLTAFKDAVTATYIVDPAKLTRANNQESMIYRVVMMAFICRTFLTFLKSLTAADRRYIKDSKANIKRIKEYLADFKATYGFSLLE